jgi:hypothetical protein
MKQFQVPTHEVAARVLLDDGRVLECGIFASDSGPAGHPQTLAERLNETDEEFIPVKSGEDRFLLSKSGVVTVEVGDAASETVGMDQDAGIEIPVRLSLTGGLSLLGRFHIVMPPERSRVLDYLNAAPRFLTLLGEDRVTLVQRNYIVSVRSETG